MERFAFKIDAALKANLYKICRLCGIDNPSKVPILPKSGEIIDLDEPTLCQKVFELVGYMVAHNDKMPQTMCTLCVDKINDFYEFREMCYATNNQTRELLGLKKAEPQKLSDEKPIVKSEPVSVMLPAKRGRKRKTEDPVTTAVASSSNRAKSSGMGISLDAVKKEPIHWRKKQRLQQLSASKTEVKEEPTELDPISNKITLPAKKTRKASCSVCGERFESKELAEEHKVATHVPTVLRYICCACNQSHHNPSDIKAHQLWHKLSRTPYQCPRCDVSVANNYAFTRHLREHTVTTPINLLVLDRECPLCKKTFLTNYFYNTHPCARRTRKCGGCSRPLNSEIAYMRHAPHCAKIYLNHSKHIMPDRIDHEAEVRIKNEYDVELEDNANSSIVYAHDGDMQPVVVLERMASPELRASSGSNSLGRSSDRVSSKKYLKRVDQLLKNTMSTLVSIKHEPEVQIDDTGPHPDSEPDEEPPAFDDFHAGNDESDEDESSSIAATAAADIATVSVKQELADEGYERQPVKQEPFKLKLKITNNHGQLNSSLVDEDNDLQLQSKSAKKKKKRKHKDRNKESGVSDKPPPTDASQGATDDTTEAAVTIKQERFDDIHADNCEPQADFQPQATVMTSIPMLQLDSSYSDVNPGTEPTPVEPDDVKPNRLELDRLMQITHIASGVVMAEEAMPPESTVEAMPNETHAAKPKKKSATKSTARKSTGGVSREAASSSKAPPGEVPRLQIVAVESGAVVPFNMIAVKPEPRNRGYADDLEGAEQGEAEEEQQRIDATNEINHNEKIDEEDAYIHNLDLSNVIIKQETDLHISDVNINSSEEDNVNYNGLRTSEDDDEDADDDDDSASSADEAEENMDTYEEQEEPIYREIELPPLEEQTPGTNPTADAQSESEMSVDHEALPGSVVDQYLVPGQTEPQLMSIDAERVDQAAPPGALLEQTESEMMPIEAERVEQEPSLGALLEQTESEMMPIEAERLEQEPSLGALVEQTESKLRPIKTENVDEAPSSHEAVEPNLVLAESESEILPLEAQSVHNEAPSVTLEENRVPAQSRSEMPQVEQSDGLQQSEDTLEPHDKESEAVSELIPMEPQTTEQTPLLSALELNHQPSQSESVEERQELESNLEPDHNMVESQVPQSEVDNALKAESQQTSDFSFVITSVCSQSEKPIPSTDDATSDKSEENIISPVVTLSAPKDNETLATPFFPTSTNYNCDEEQQNVLNHELSASTQQVELTNEEQLSLPAIEEAEEQQLEQEAGSSSAGCNELPGNDNEETENRINEQQQELQQEQQLQQPRCPAIDDSNINEIAENNNNANIERELNDDANGAQENPIP